MLSILLLNFSRQAGDLGSNLAASYKILVAMATKMVLTWRVELVCLHAREMSVVNPKNSMAVTSSEIYVTTPFGCYSVVISCKSGGDGGTEGSEPPTFYATFLSGSHLLELIAIEIKLYLPSVL